MGFLASLLVLALFSFGVAEDHCPRGDLDSRYCDRDGDLVADPPTDPSEFLNPDTLIFAMLPGEDPAVYRTAWTEFVTHMEEVTGKQVQFVPISSFGAQVEALRANRAHIAGVPTGSVPVAVNMAGFVPRAMIAYDDGSYGYTMQIITHRDSDIHSLEDLRGRTLAGVDPNSNSGYKAPAALLYAELGLVPNEDYGTTFSGSHDTSILGVQLGDYEVAAIANTALLRLVDAGRVDMDELRIVYESQAFPPVAYGYVHNLDPELAEKVVEAFTTFDWEGTQLEAQYGASDGNTFMPITYLEHWQVIRDVDAGLDAIGLD